MNDKELSLKIKAFRRPFGSAYIQEKCVIESCTFHQRSKGVSKVTGRTIYDKYCNWHHRIKYSIHRFPQALNYIIKIPNKRCTKCGWDKAGCDRHRIVSSKGYIPENVLILCPNCHRLKHLGLI